MPTIEELGKSTKKLWPGSYDYFDDRELGLWMQKKYPGWDGTSRPHQVSAIPKETQQAETQMLFEGTERGGSAQRALPTFEELGKAAKKLWPGSYDYFDDRELGLRMRQKYPGWDGTSRPHQVSAIPKVPRQAETQMLQKYGPEGTDRGGPAARVFEGTRGMLKSVGESFLDMPGILAAPGSSQYATFRENMDPYVAPYSRQEAIGKEIGNVGQLAAGAYEGIISAPRIATELMEAVRGAPQITTELAQAVRGAPKIATELMESVRGAPKIATELMESARGAPQAIKNATAGAQAGAKAAGKLILKKSPVGRLYSLGEQAVKAYKDAQLAERAKSLTPAQKQAAEAEAQKLVEQFGPEGKPKPAPKPPPTPPPTAQGTPTPPPTAQGTPTPEANAKPTPEAKPKPAPKKTLKANAKPTPEANAKPTPEAKPEPKPAPKPEAKPTPEQQASYDAAWKHLEEDPSHASRLSVNKHNTSAQNKENALAIELHKRNITSDQYQSMIDRAAKTGDWNELNEIKQSAFESGKRFGKVTTKTLWTGGIGSEDTIKNTKTKLDLLHIRMPRK
jgi:hypothetical protein